VAGRAICVIGSSICSACSRHARLLLQLAAHGIEGCADRDVDVLVRAGVAANDDLMARDLQVDADMIEPTLLPVRMAAFDHHATADDAPEEPFEGFRALADAASTAGEGSMWRKVICNGRRI
jgi:hypothetical protein